MILKRLNIGRLPGIDQPFSIECPGPGIHVIYGPNGIGKSSICRAVKSLYWGDRGPSERVSVDGQFEFESDVWWVEREGSRLVWRSGDDTRVAPSLPLSHHEHCFFLQLRDLIDPSRGGTQDIASEIKRQMSGGFDLQQIVDADFPILSPQYGRHQRREFNKAEQLVQSEEGRQVRLQRDADRLRDLEIQLEQAKADRQRLRFVDEAMDLVDNKRELDIVNQEISELPDALENLLGNELTEVVELQSKVDDYSKRIQETTLQRDDARERKQQSRLAEPLDGTELTLWKKRVDDLYRSESNLCEEKLHQAAWQKKYLSALNALGTIELGNMKTTVKDHSQLFGFLRVSDKLRNERSAVEEQKRVLVSFEQNEEPPTDREVLREAIDCLRLWLRTPGSSMIEEKSIGTRITISIAITLGIIAIGVMVFLEPYLATILIVVCGLLFSVDFWRKNLRKGDERNNAKLKFQNLQIENLESWSVDSVDARLRELEKEFTEVDTRMHRSFVRGTEIRTLEIKLDEIAEREARHYDDRNEIMESLQLTSFEDAELVDLVRTLDEIRKASIELDAFVERVNQRQEQYLGSLDNLKEFLELYGEPSPNDATAAKARVDSLTSRSSQLEQAIRDENQARLQLEQVSADRQSTVDSINRIFERAALEVGDFRGLEQMLKQRPRYLELVTESSQINRDIDRATKELEENGQSDTLINCDKSQLEELKQNLTESASTADELRDEIAEIKAQVNEAERNYSLQHLIEEREQARSELKDRRDHAIFTTAGRFLVEEVEREYGQSQMPRVFERARELFSGFTHYGYRLELGRSAESPRLYATDLRTDEPRELDELSDGTRAQLLLAARMAFAEEVERGDKLPLFLDEALDQSDPRRFEAIARSLARIAKDQERQIIYLTSDPLDRHRINDAVALENCDIVADIDLGLIRTNTPTIADASNLELSQISKIPTPDGTTLEEYAMKIGVTPLNPAHGYKPQDFFYILFDELDLLHKIRSAGIDRIGQWREKSVSEMTEYLASESTSVQTIDRRVNLFEVFCELWALGRGKTIDRDVLAASNVVTGRYIDDLAAIAIDHDDNPEALILILRERMDSRVRGFRKKSIDALEDYFHDFGYIDDRDVLDENEISSQALAGFSDTDEFLGDAQECLSRWWNWAENPITSN